MAPIHDACISGDIDEVKRILDASNDPKALLESKDDYGNNPYVLSLIHKKYDIMRHITRGRTWTELYALYVNVSKNYKLDCTLHDIIHNGFNEGYTEEYIIENIQTVLQNDSILTTRDCNLNTPLHIACEHRLSKVVQLLLDNGADVSAVNRNLDHPIHVLCNIYAEDSPEVFKEILLALMKQGANLKAVNIHNQTPCDLVFDNLHNYDSASEIQKAFTKVMVDNVVNLQKSLEHSRKENIVTPQVQELLIHVSIAMKQLEDIKNT